MLSNESTDSGLVSVSIRNVYEKVQQQNKIFSKNDLRKNARKERDCRTFSDSVQALVSGLFLPDIWDGRSPLCLFGN